MCLLHHPVWLQLVLALSGQHFNFWNHFVWRRITDEGSLPEMRIWSILLIKSDLKWCFHLIRSLFLYYYQHFNTSQILATSVPAILFRLTVDGISIRVIQERKILFTHFLYFVVIKRNLVSTQNCIFTYIFTVFFFVVKLHKTCQTHFLFNFNLIFRHHNSLVKFLHFEKIAASFSVFVVFTNWF